MEAPSDSEIPFVDYLVLQPSPHLVASECCGCGVRYVDRRNACARCFTQDFQTVTLSTQGTLVSYTIVNIAAPGLPVPFIAGIVDCGGTWIRTNLVNVEPDPAQIQLGGDVSLTTFPVGTDASGTTAINYGFEPGPHWRTTNGD